MISYPQQKQSFLKLLLSSLRWFPAALIAVWPFSLVAGLLTTLYVYIVQMAHYSSTTILSFFIISLAIIYCYACGLRKMDAHLAHQKLNLINCCIDTAKNSGLIYAGFFLSLLILCLAFSVGYLIVKLVSVLVPANSQLLSMVSLVFLGMPLLLLSTWLISLVPHLVVHKKALIPTVLKVFKLTGFKNWFSAFFLYILALALMYFSAPGSRHMEFLYDNYLVLPAMLTLYLIWLPLMVSYSLLLLHKLESR